MSKGFPSDNPHHGRIPQSFFLGFIRFRVCLAIQYVRCIPGRISILEDEKFLQLPFRLMKRILENRGRVTECVVLPTLMLLPNQGCLDGSRKRRKHKPAYEWAGSKPPTTSCREGSECSCHHARDPRPSASKCICKTPDWKLFPAETTVSGTITRMSLSKVFAGNLSTFQDASTGIQS